MDPEYGKSLNEYGLTMRETDEYDRLVDFFVENELEFDGDEEVDTDIVKCYKVVDGKDNLIGGAVLALREGRYILDGIAVDAKYRDKEIGKTMLEQLLGDVKERGGDSLYLIAKVPGFYKKNGFITIDADKAPNFFECKTCPQYHVNCFPEVMKKEL